MLSGVPELSASRILTRYRRVEDESATTANRIEAIELVKFYPSVSTDPNPAPLLTLKSRLAFDRN